MLRDTTGPLIPKPRVSLKLSRYRLCDTVKPAVNFGSVVLVSELLLELGESSEIPSEPLFIYLLIYLLRRQRGTGTGLWVSQEV